MIWSRRLWSSFSPELQRRSDQITYQHMVQDQQQLNLDRQRNELMQMKAEMQTQAELRQREWEAAQATQAEHAREKAFTPIARKPTYSGRPLSPHMQPPPEGSRQYREPEVLNSSDDECGDFYHESGLPVYKGDTYVPKQQRRTMTTRNADRGQSFSELSESPSYTPEVRRRFSELSLNPTREQKQTTMMDTAVSSLMQSIVSITKQNMNQTALQQLPHFTGEKEDFDRFIMEYETKCEALGINPSEAIKLKVAGNILRGLKNFSAKTPWNIIRKHLYEQYSDIPTTAHANSPLLNVQQRKGESLVDYQSRVAALNMMSCQKTPAQTTDRVRIQCYATGILNHKIREKTLTAEYDNLQRYFDYSLRVQRQVSKVEGAMAKEMPDLQISSITAGEGYPQPAKRKTPMPTAINTEEPTRSTQYQNRPRHGSTGWKDYQDTTPTIQNTENQGGDAVLPYVRPSAKPYMTCFHCGMKGHIKRECPSLQ